MKYRHLAIFTLFLANLMFAVAFCLGMYMPLAAIAGALLLLGAGFWLVQGKVRMGYQYSVLLAATALAQWYFKVPDVYPIVSASCAVVFVALQTIERIFRAKKLLPA